MRVNLRDIAAAAEYDPAQALLDSLGDISGLQPMFNQILVATYIEPEKTKGGIIKPDNAILEGRFQGKVHLVLKLGPTAFKYDGSYQYEGPKIEVGDWIVARPTDGFEFFSLEPLRHDATPCRFYEDRFILGKTNRPDAVW